MTLARKVLLRKQALPRKGRHTTLEQLQGDGWTLSSLASGGSAVLFNKSRTRTALFDKKTSYAKRIEIGFEPVKVPKLIRPIVR